VVRSYRCWILAVSLDVLAVVLTASLAATSASLYGSLDAGRTVNMLVPELLALMAVVALARRTLVGADWARSLLAFAGVPYALFLVLHAVRTLLPPESGVALQTDGIAAVRLIEAAALVVAVTLMFAPATRPHFERQLPPSRPH
jgi:predicted anti-sigma-YlaC factor YlaD